MVTERAKDALLRTKMTANIVERDVGLRITADTSGRWTLFPDRPQPDDHVIEHQGTTVLVLGPDIQQILSGGGQVDCVPNPQGVEELMVSQPRRDAPPRDLTERLLREDAFNAAVERFLADIGATGGRAIEGQPR
jgi:hypothetical protein